jgi:hypothetical protein
LVCGPTEFDGATFANTWIFAGWNILINLHTWEQVYIAMYLATGIRCNDMIVREKNELIARDNPWGFRVQIPKYKFNRGELYNLLIERGTLTEEERYIINDHMAQTIFMLDKLPLPGHLRAVPEIAGGHHEKIDGSGYPRGLTGGEMSILAKIMAIADIFEALTANDRPYKRPNTLSQALGILVKMAQENHIDADLLALFIQSGAYREYGQCYLQKNQCDEVDEIALLSTLATLNFVKN